MRRLAYKLTPHPEERAKPSKTSLWEPTKQTEAYWWKVIQEESRNWEEKRAGLGLELCRDPDDPEWEGELRPILPGIIEDGTSETFTVPPDMAKYWASATHEAPMELPPVKVDSLEDAPLYDDDVSDANEDASGRRGCE